MAVEAVAKAAAVAKVDLEVSEEVLFLEYTGHPQIQMVILWKPISF
jgi:hypothetical protein